MIDMDLQAKTRGMACLASVLELTGPFEDCDKARRSWKKFCSTYNGLEAIGLVHHDVVVERRIDHGLAINAIIVIKLPARLCLQKHGGKSSPAISVVVRKPFNSTLRNLDIITVACAHSVRRGRGTKRGKALYDELRSLITGDPSPIGPTAPSSTTLRSGHPGRKTSRKLGQDDGGPKDDFGASRRGSSSPRGCTLFLSSPNATCACSLDHSSHQLDPGKACCHGHQIRLGFGDLSERSSRS